MSLEFEPQRSNPKRMNEKKLNIEKRNCSIDSHHVLLIIILSLLLCVLITMPPEILASEEVEVDIQTSAEIAQVDELNLDNVISNLDLDNDGEIDDDIVDIVETNTITIITPEVSKEIHDVNVVKAAPSAEEVNMIYEAQEQKALEEALLAEENRLLDTYHYALYDTGGRRTDITSDLLKYLETKCQEWGLNPHFVLGVMMTESEGHANAKNPSSTASGLGQTLRGTGKSVWEDILGHGKGSYNHSMAFDPYVSTDMTVAYLGTLVRQRGGLHRAIQSYRGKNNVKSYESSINSYMQKGGVSLYSLNY